MMEEIMHYLISLHPGRLFCNIMFFCIVVLFSVIVYDKKLKRASAENYIRYFRSYYAESKSMRRAWENMVSHSAPDCMECQIIQKALFYLDHSICPDYKTAAKMIESYFENAQVEELHRPCLDALQRDGILRLEQKG